MSKKGRIGLRLYELESAFASNLDSTSPRLRSYRTSRLLGQAARLCQLIRGLDVIENQDKLVAISAAQLKIDPMHFDDVLDVLEEVDLAERRNGKIYEKVRLLDFGENYERVGELWVQRAKDAREEITIAESCRERPVDPLPSQAAGDERDSTPQFVWRRSCRLHEEVQYLVRLAPVASRVCDTRPTLFLQQKNRPSPAAAER